MVDPKSIRERDELRERFLVEMYEAASGSSTEILELTSIATKLGISLEDAHNIAGFLGGEGLLKRENYNYIRITHNGVQWVESQMRFTAGSAVGDTSLTLPPEITDSLRRFREDFPYDVRTAFLMMRFGNTRAHRQITAAIRSVLESHGIHGLRADDKYYHDDLFQNIRTYIYGCTFGIAVFERIEKDEFNPNVSLEVGYMFGLGRDVCLLKDRTLQTLQTDLTGRLYVEFDPLELKATLPPRLTKWLKDKRYLTT